MTAELIKWSGLCDVYEAELRSKANTVFPKNEDGDSRWTQLKNRVVEHVCNYVYFSYEFSNKSFEQRNQF